MTISIFPNAYGSTKRPSNVWLGLGDSLTMRYSYYTTSITTSISGTDVSLSHSGSIASVGDTVRFYNQADLEVAYTNAKVISNNGTTVVVRFPFSVAGRVSGTTSYFIVESYSDTGWQGYARGIMNKQGRFCQYKNWANGGATTQDMVDSLSYISQVGDYDFVSILGGINDLTDTDDPDGIIANLELLYNYFLDRGVPVVAGTVWPVTSGDTRDTVAKKAAIITINNYIREKTASEPNMYLWDGYAAIKDPATDYALSGYLETAGVHALAAGAQVLGAAFVEGAGKLFERLGEKTSTGVSYYYNDPSLAAQNILTNPEFSGTGGTKTGGGTLSGSVPDSWTLDTTAGTTTLSKTTHQSGSGSVLSVTKAHTASNAATFFQEITTSVSLGGRYVFGAEYETLTANTGHYIRIYLQYTVGGAAQYHRVIANTFSYANGGRLPTAGTKYELQSEIITIPTDATNVYFYFVSDNGASGDHTFTIARPYVRRVV